MLAKIEDSDWMQCLGLGHHGAHETLETRPVFLRKCTDNMTLPGLNLGVLDPGKVDTESSRQLHVTLSMVLDVGGHRVTQVQNVRTVSRSLPLRLAGRGRQ